MKITFGAEEKKYITVAELPAVRKLIEQMKEYDSKTFEEFADSALSYVTGGHSADKIFDVKAEICGNSRVWNYYTDDSEHLDIWVEISALNWMDGGWCFVMLGFNLTDLWNVGNGDEESINELKAHSYVRIFREDR